MSIAKITRSVLAFGVLAVAAAANAVDYQWEVYRTPLAGYDNTWLLGMADDGFAHVFVFNQVDAANRYYFERNGKIETPQLDPLFSSTDVAVGGLMSGTLHTSFPSNTQFAAVRKRNGDIETTKLPDVAVNATGNGISDSGRMVGSYRDITDPSSYTYRGFFYHGGKTTVYDYPNALYTVLNDVNDQGWATGLAYGYDFYTPFITNGKQSIPLATGLDYFSQFVPRFINNSRTIVGDIVDYSTGWPTSTPAVYQNATLTPVVSPKTWPATIELIGFAGWPETYVYESSKLVVTSLTNKGEISAMSIATYHPEFAPWFQYTFVESYVGRPTKA